MTNDAGDAGKVPAESALDAVDQIVHGADRKGWINLTMKINNLAVGGFAHANVMHFVKAG